MSNSLECEIAGIKFANPIILASGILGVVPSSMIRLSKAGIGGLTTKTVGPQARIGYSNPSIIEIDNGTFLNSVGLANPGINFFVDEIQEIKKEISTPLIVSVFGDGPKGFAATAKLAEKAGADAIEINISCPHAEVASISLSPELTKEFIQEVKKTVKIPVYAKITPNITNIIPIAQAAEKVGVDAIVAINTVRGLSIDYKTGRPVLAHGIGGISGRAIKPIGVRIVYEIYPHVNIPIIGCGGISTWKDVLEYIYAGATAIQIGSGFSMGPEIISDIKLGLNNFLNENKIANLQNLKGKAHEFTDQLEAKPRICQ